MTEIQAFLEVRKKFPLVSMKVLEWGKVECISDSAVVAVLNKDKDDQWTIAWSSEQPKAVPASAPTSVPTFTEKS